MVDKSAGGGALPESSPHAPAHGEQRRRGTWHMEVCRRVVEFLPTGKSCPDAPDGGVTS